MTYISGFVLPAVTAKRDTYRERAAAAAVLFKEFGALRVVECWGDDVPDGKLTSFPMAVKREATETVVLSWVEWPSKAAADAGMKKVMDDPRMAIMADIPVDGRRMIFGGFDVIVDI